MEIGGRKEIARSLLIIVLDVNPGQRIIRQDTRILTHCLDSIIVFANAHLMQTSNNELAFLVCHSNGAMFLYPDERPDEARQMDGQYEIFTRVERNIRKKLQQDIGTIPCDGRNNGGSLISGALTMALCYIARLKREKLGAEKFYSRILIITGGNDSVTQYMNYMNIFFTAQKMGVILDVCNLDQEMTLLQQACDITGGNYLKVPTPAGLLQYLLWVFLPDPEVRSKLVLPPPVKVDYRAACFCHRELVDIGYVCSVCLSSKLDYSNVILVFCKFSPICTTCHTLFKMPGPMPLKTKKKKKYPEIVH